MTASTKATPSRPVSPRALLSVRTLLILTTAALIAVAVGTLTALAGQPWATAVLAGLTAGGASIVTLNSIVGR